MSSPGAAGTYPGNPSLPVEVREKILMTFRHALGLFSSGHVDDCLIGCEFILKMDPRFTPARRLQEKVRNRDSDVDISELQAMVDPGTAGVGPAPPPPARPVPAEARPTPAREDKPDVESLLAESGQKFDARDFDGAIALASRALTLDHGNREALAIVEKAAGKKATQPLVETSRARAEQGIAAGRLAEARQELERIRSLDPYNPATGELERRIASATSATAGFPPAAADFSLEPGETSARPTGGLRGESGPDLAGLPSEPFGLDPLSHPASFAEIEPPGGDDAEASSLDSLSPGEEALVPPPPPSADLFLPADGAGNASSISDASLDEEDTGAALQEIASLLKQGDDISHKGDRQQAIEIWSRVFLIDINNAEAVTRIEKARQEMAEEAKLVAELLRNGRESFEAGDRDSARKFFLQVQALDPEEATARVYLERLERGQVEPAQAAAGAPTASRAAGPPAKEALDLVPAPAPEAPTGRRLAFPIQRRVFAVVGTFLVLTLVGVYLVLKGGRSQEPPAKVVSKASLAHVRDLLGKGEIEEARAELKQIPPGDADAAEAQKMLVELGHRGVPEISGGSPAGPAGSGERTGRSESDPARLRVNAEKALGEKRYIEALKDFNLAAPAFRNDPDFAQKQGLAAEKVTALTPAVKFYNEGEYETAIPILWRIVQEDRDNQDARSYLLRSYYNEGITQLQNGLYQKAMQAFQEALALDPNDADAVRHRKFAERYQKGDLDLMGRIYVRHLNHRP